MIDRSKSIGQNIKEIIEKQGYTQKEVAIGTGIAESNLSRIVKGTNGTKPSPQTLEKLAAFLNVPIESFYNGDVRHVELTTKFLKELPDDIADAFTDVRNRDHLLFGLEVKDSGLPLEDIRMAMEIMKKHQETKKKK